MQSTLRSILLTGLIAACGGDDDGIAARDVITNHATVVAATYDDAVRGAVALQVKIDAFVASPTPATLEAARRAWIEARESYGQTEAFRFADGPIDDDDGPEGQINAWPLDEAYIDYVDGNANAGIVNTLSIQITTANLIAINGGAMGDVTGIGADFDGEKAIATGYHAIEFLLWGQDRNPSGAGSRSHADFLTTGEATAPNGARRGEMLKVLAALLVDDLESVAAEWAEGGPYRATWLALSDDEALGRMLSSMGILAKGELASERMDVALESLDQEDEHSCFSDNTHRDIFLNARGIENVWRGDYEWHEGPGLDELVRQNDAGVADALDAAIAASREATALIPVPFDQAIRVNGSPSWMKVDTAVKALFAQADATIDAGTAIGLANISVDLPE